VALWESIALPNTDEVMVGEPIIPLIPARLHNTIEGNMELWLNSKLWTYDDRHDTSRAKLGWTQDLQQRYSRRKNVAMWVKLTAQLVMDVNMDWEQDSHTLLEVARVIDEERGQQTVVSTLEQFLNESPYSWRKKRVCKRKNDLSVEVVCLNTEEYYDTN
jgi:hypothetical protein